MVESVKLDFLSKIINVNWGGHAFIQVFPSVAGAGASFKVSVINGKIVYSDRFGVVLDVLASQNPVFSITFTGPPPPDAIYQFSILLYDKATSIVDSFGNILFKANKAFFAVPLFGFNGPLAFYKGNPVPPLLPGRYTFNVQKRPYKATLIFETWPSATSYIVNVFRLSPLNPGSSPSLPIPPAWQGILRGPPPRQ